MYIVGRIACLVALFFSLYLCLRVLVECFCWVDVIVEKKHNTKFVVSVCFFLVSLHYYWLALTGAYCYDNNKYI